MSLERLQNPFGVSIAAIKDVENPVTWNWLTNPQALLELSQTKWNDERWKAAAAADAADADAAAAAATAVAAADPAAVSSSSSSSDAGKQKAAVGADTPAKEAGAQVVHAKIGTATGVVDSLASVPGERTATALVETSIASPPPAFEMAPGLIAMRNVNAFRHSFVSNKSMFFGSQTLEQCLKPSQQDFIRHAAKQISDQITAEKAEKKESAFTHTTAAAAAK